MNYSSNVLVYGAVAAIDQEKRDISVLTKTPKGKDVLITVHMWKSPAISDNPAHADRSDWQDDVEIGKNVLVIGHMGNNGRVIATRFTFPKEASLQPEAGETLYA